MEASAINAPHPDDEPSSDDLEGFFDPPSEEELTEEFQETAAEPDPAALPDLTPEQAKAEGEAYREEKEGVKPEDVPEPLQREQQLREIAEREAAQKPEEQVAAEPEQISVAGTASAPEQGSRQQEREYIVFQQVPLTEKVLKGLLESLPSDGTPRVAYFELHRAEARNVNGAVSTAYETHKDALGNKCDLAAVTDRAWQTRHVEVKPITETQLAIS